jgi:hypothetical protein
MDNLALTGLISWGFFLPLLTIPFISQHLAPQKIPVKCELRDVIYTFVLPFKQPT